MKKYIINPIDKATQGIKFDLIGLTLLGGIIGYNIYDVNRFSNFSKYSFQLTHIAAWFMFAIIVANIILKKSKYLENKTKQQAHFLNAIGFSFALSLLVDIMYWTKIYSPASIHGTADFADALLMHAAITVVFLIWLVAEKKSSFGKQRKSFESWKESFSWRVIVPIVSITLLYMGWTALGQEFITHNVAIYSDVIDWNHLGTTFTTFGMAFALLFFIVLAYNYLLPKVLPKMATLFCGKRNDAVNENDLKSPSTQNC